MHIRTFRAANLQAALADIRQQMGPGASVLHTRQVREGWLGWLGRTQVEVTAGLRDSNDLTKPNLTVHGRPESHGNDRLSQLAEPANAFRTNNAAGPVGYESRGGYEKNASEHNTAFQNGAGQGVLSPIAELFFARLIQSGAHEQSAARWLSSAASFSAHLRQENAPELLDDQNQWWEHLQRAVSRELNLSGPIRTQPGDRRVVALVGPTGVGKTTTVAKLAAGFRIQAKRRVGLLTIDTYRIAAVQQLRAYADIMDLPMQVVETPEQMPAAMAELGDVDLVLIDTAGRSPRSDARVQQLNQFLRTAQPDEIHLVLSATSSYESIAATLQGFAPIRASSVILTKLDEAVSTASALSALLAGERFLSTPLSYVTNGQQVPDDINLADAGTLIHSLLPAMPELPMMDSGTFRAVA